MVRGVASQDLGRPALSGILRARGLNVVKVSPEATRLLGAIVAQALQEGQPDAYVEALLRATHREGMYQPDAALLSESGQVGARTMLSQIVRQAGGRKTPHRQKILVEPGANCGLCSARTGRKPIASIRCSPVIALAI